MAGSTIAKRPTVPVGVGSACFGPGNSGVEGAPGDVGEASAPGTVEYGSLGLIGPGLRPSSVAIYRRDVADFLRWWRRPPGDATAADVTRYLAERATSPASADRRLAILGYFYRAGVAARRWPVDPTAGIARARRGSWR
jgi:Phage integrase, N-terminal SAM-like domain